MNRRLAVERTFSLSVTGLRWRDGWGAGCTALAAAFLLAACSSASDQPGAVTADEARQLNEAAAMLDANSVALNAVTTNESAMP